MTKTKSFISTTWIMRCMVALIVVLSLLTGYYHQRWVIEAKKYAQLERAYESVQVQLKKE